MKKHYVFALLLFFSVTSFVSCEKEANCHTCIAYADTSLHGNPYFLRGNRFDSVVCGPGAYRSFISAYTRVDTEIGYIPTSAGIYPVQAVRTWHAKCN